MSITSRSAMHYDAVVKDPRLADQWSLSLSIYTEEIKRIIDILGVCVLIVMLAPLMVLIALLIKMTSPGPVIFKQRRLGWDGCEFWCYKFRTMDIDAEERLSRDETLCVRFEENFKLKDDPRLSPLGCCSGKPVSTSYPSS